MHSTTLERPITTSHPRMISPRRVKFAVIGGGLVGMGTAFELKRRAPHAEVQILEK